MNTMKRKSLIIVCLVLFLKINTTEQCRIMARFVQFGRTANTQQSDNITEIEEEKVSEDTLRERFPDLDPEAYMDARELIESKGIPYESHTVETEDGYLLGLQRLSRPNSTQQYPVLLMHGLLSSCESFLLNRRDQSLAYILYDRGFDVWLGNVRGTKYSRNHTTLDPESKEFWDWSFDEIGKYDVPAMIDHVLGVTGKSKLNYIGHSQGAMVLFSSVIQHQWWYQTTSQIGQKIANFVALAPAVYIEHAWSGFMKDVLHVVDVGADLLDPFWGFLGSKLTHDEYAPALSDFLIRTCYGYPLTCMPAIADLNGYSRDFNTSRLGVYLLHEPSGSSTKNMRHWIQMSRRSNNVTGMQYYDYGDWMKNMKRYRTLSMQAPEYNFLRFYGVKTFVYCGENDAMVTLEDCQRLSEVVNESDVKFRRVDGFSHFDFAYSPVSKYTVYEDILHDIMGSEYEGPPSPCLPNVYRPLEFDPSSCDDNTAEQPIIVNPTKKPRRKQWKKTPAAKRGRKKPSTK